MSRSRRRLGAFWLFAGTMHFVRAREYEATVPAYVPIATATRSAGAASPRSPAAWRRSRARPAGSPAGGCSALLVAVFPANVHMALEPDEVAERGVADRRLPRWLLWARLPIQPLFILWAWRATER